MSLFCKMVVHLMVLRIEQNIRVNRQKDVSYTPIDKKRHLLRNKQGKLLISSPIILKYKQNSRLFGRESIDLLKFRRRTM